MEKRLPCVEYKMLHLVQARAFLLYLWLSLTGPVSRDVINMWGWLGERLFGMHAASVDDTAALRSPPLLPLLLLSDIIINMFRPFHSSFKVLSSPLQFLTYLSFHTSPLSAIIKSSLSLSPPLLSPLLSSPLTSLLLTSPSHFPFSPS